MKKLAQSNLSTGAGTLLYTVPNTYHTEVINIDAANTTSSAVTCSVHLVPSGGSVDASNMLFPAISIPANTLLQWTGVQSLDAGDFIQGIGSATGITINITGTESPASR